MLFPTSNASKSRNQKQKILDSGVLGTWQQQNIDSKSLRTELKNSEECHLTEKFTSNQVQTRISENFSFWGLSIYFYLVKTGTLTVFFLSADKCVEVFGSQTGENILCLFHI